MIVLVASNTYVIFIGVFIIILTLVILIGTITRV